MTRRRNIRVEVVVLRLRYFNVDRATENSVQARRAERPSSWAPAFARSALPPVRSLALFGPRGVFDLSPRLWGKTVLNQLAVTNRQSGNRMGDCPVPKMDFGAHGPDDYSAVGCSGSAIDGQ
jgi:hypothetical protein